VLTEAKRSGAAEEPAIRDNWAKIMTDKSNEVQGREAFDSDFSDNSGAEGKENQNWNRETNVKEEGGGRGTDQQP
jgi:hypothetical protein